MGRRGEVGEASDHHMRCIKQRARLADPFWIQSHQMAGLGVDECAIPPRPIPAMSITLTGTCSTESREQLIHGCHLAGGGGHFPLAQDVSPTGILSRWNNFVCVQCSIYFLGFLWFSIHFSVFLFFSWFFRGTQVCFMEHIYASLGEHMCST